MVTKNQCELSRKKLEDQLFSLRKKFDDNTDKNPKVLFIDSVYEVLRKMDRISERTLSGKYKLANDIYTNFIVLVDYQLQKTNELVNIQEKDDEKSAEDSKKTTEESELDTKLTNAIENLTNIAEELPNNLKKSLQKPITVAIVTFGLALTFAFIISGLAGAPEFTSMALGFKHFLFDLGEFFTHAVAGAPGNASVAITATISTAFATLSTVFCGMAVGSGYNNYRKATLFAETRELLFAAPRHYKDGFQQNKEIDTNAQSPSAPPELNPENTTNNNNNNNNNNP